MHPVTVFPPIIDFYDVNQGEIAIARIDQMLVTGGMGPCSALIIRDSEKMLLMHADAGSKSDRLAGVIHEYFDTSDPCLSVVIVPGDGLSMPTTLSEAVIDRALDTLSLAARPQRRPDLYTSSMNTLVVTGHTITEEPGKKNHRFLGLDMMSNINPQTAQGR